MRTSHYLPHTWFFFTRTHTAALYLAEREQSTSSSQRSSIRTEEREREREEKELSFLLSLSLSLPLLSLFPKGQRPVNPLFLLLLPFSPAGFSSPLPFLSISAMCVLLRRAGS